LEGADRIGGRIRTIRRPDWSLPLELGAEFVHGRPSPTLALDHGSLTLAEVPENRVEVGATIRPMPDVWAQFAALMRLTPESHGSCSVLDHLLSVNADPVQERLVRLMVEGYHAAPLDDISASAVCIDAESAAREHRQYRVVGGYDGVIASLEHGLAGSSAHIELGARVARVDWSRSKVQLAGVVRGEAFELGAERCIVTVSIGVLKREPDAAGIEFRPYPRTLKASLEALAMGHVVKVILRFRRPPWHDDPAIDQATFLHAPETRFPTFWRERSGDDEQVTAWSAGPRALELTSKSAEELRELALRAWASAVRRDAGECRRALLEAHHHDFSSDPMTRGAYSYLRPGGESASRRLAEPIDHTLFFAGEALDAQYPSTVAGALGSGEHAARQVLRELA
jgi:monoamine oxidase